MIFISKWFWHRPYPNVIYVQQQRGKYWRISLRKWASSWMMQRLHISSPFFDCSWPFDQYSLFVALVFTYRYHRCQRLVHFHQNTNQFDCLQVTKYLDASHSQNTWNEIETMIAFAFLSNFNIDVFRLMSN